MSPTPKPTGGRYWKRLQKATEYELTRLGYNPLMPSFQKPRFRFNEKSFDAFWNGDVLHIDYRVAVSAIGGLRDSPTPKQLMEILAFYAD